MFKFFKKEKKADAIDKHNLACYNLTNSDAWADIQTMFIDKIMEIQSVMNVDDSSVEKAVMDMKVRVLLAKELKDILDRIIAASNAYQFANQSYQQDEDHIIRDEVVKDVV